MGWSDSETHYKRIVRIQRILDALDIPMNRILDVGCGIGMVHNLWGLLYTPGTYHGVDILPEYVEEARKNVAKDSNAVITCEDFLKWESIDSFSVTLAIGAFAWQPLDVVMGMIAKMWSLTSAGGAMAFTMLPNNPIPLASFRWLKGELDAAETLVYEGYSNRLHEHIVVMRKAEAEIVNRHQEELEDEVARGEHIEDPDPRDDYDPTRDDWIK